MHFRLTEVRSSECCSLAKLMKTYQEKPRNNKATSHKCDADRASNILKKDVHQRPLSHPILIIFMRSLERAGEFQASDRRSKRPCSNASALRTFHLIKRMLATDVSCMRSNLSPAIITLFIQVIDAASPQMAIVRALFAQAILELKNSGVFSVKKVNKHALMSRLSFGKLRRQANT